MTKKTIKKIEPVSDSKDKELFSPTGYGGFTNKEVQILNNTSFRACENMSDLAMACNIAKKYDLDPFSKEIWAMKIQNKIVVEASASGWRKIIRRQPQFKRMVVQPWYSDDDIFFDLVLGKVTKHNHAPQKRSEKINPDGAYCFVEYLDGTSNLAVVYWEEYENAGNNSGSPWKKQKSEMIKNKASAVFGRTYAGVSGLYLQGEITEIPSKQEAVEDKKQKLRERKKFGYSSAPELI
jgi:hypothetical protein